MHRIMTRQFVIKLFTATILWAIASIYINLTTYSPSSQEYYDDVASSAEFYEYNQHSVTFKKPSNDEDAIVMNRNSATKVKVTPKHTPHKESDNQHYSKYIQNKPKLVLHVGPLKTGSTSMQLNIIRAKKFSPLLRSDNYQEIVGFEYAKFDELIKKCLLKGLDQCDDEPFREMETLYNTAYINAMSRTLHASNSSHLYTLHTDEDFSILPRDDFTMSLLQKLYTKWDVHFILFYRPLLDWLPSMYAQYRKYFVSRPRDPDTPFVQNYLIERDGQMSFPQYLEDSLSKGKMRDSLATYEYYDHLRERLGLSSFSSFNTTANRIQVLSMYAREGIEKEFTCNLPSATVSCQKVKDLLGQGYKFSKRNKSLELPLNLDLLIVEAWYLNLVSIKRNDAAVLLKKRMAEVKMTMQDLPHSCLSQDLMDWVWKRHLQAHQQFVGAINEQSMRQTFEKKKNNLCSVNATAAFELNSFRRLFDSCDFQSPTLLNRMLGANGNNPKWSELNCSTTPQD